MNDQDPSRRVPVFKRRGRGCLYWLSASLAALLGLALVGYIYEPMAEAADAKKYPHPGQLVDVGGYRLHIYCTGTGSPTVVIDAGLGDWSTMWGFVQPDVARTTRVCTYDRAGVGWSDAGPLPRDAAQFAKELHALLQNANIPGPYVMVGHSLGGLTMQVFSDMYPSEVAGIVLIDSMNPRQVPHSPTEVQSQSNLQSRVYSLLTVLARIGLVRSLAKPFGSFPPDEEANASIYVRPQNMQAIANESKSLAASAAEAAAVKTFGDLPLIVLTARLNDNPGWPEWQTELLQLSSNSQQLFAENSGHTIHTDEPDAAVAAIVKMVELVRQATQD